MKVKVSNVLTITDYPDHIRQWCVNNLIIPNPEYARRQRLGFWLGNTSKTLTLYEKVGDDLILPYGLLLTVYMMAPEGTTYEPDFPTPDPVNYGRSEPVPLYPYQKQAVDALIEAKYGILKSPAGSGKTQMGIALIKRFGRRALWLTHTADLLKQSKARAEMYIDHDLIGTITEGEVNIGKGVTFATIQTMCKLDMDIYGDMWDVVIVDECHRCAGTPTAVTRFYKVLNSLKARHKYGLSATVHRSDGMIEATYALLGRTVYSVPDEAVRDKIMRVGVLPVETGTQISESCLNPDGTLHYTKLINYLAQDEQRNRIIVDSIITNQAYSCLILSDRLGHLEDLMSRLPDDLRDKAVMVSGKMTSKRGKAQREKAIEDMRTGDKRFLFATYSLAKEGLDIPRLERLFMATPQKDYAVVTQSIGRIARTFDGKAKPIVLDFVDDIGYLVKAYKKRCTTYRKNHCYFVKDGDDT